MNKIAALAFAASFALTATAQAAGYQAPRNGFGQPDLQGTWTNASLTSLQRPAMFKTLTLTEAEAAAMEKRRAAARAQADKPTDPNSGAPPSANDPGGYNASWTDPGVSLGRIGGQVRTSWIVDPVDGQLPYSTTGKAAYIEALRKARNSWDGPENRPLGERCILGFGSTAGPPMLNVLYNNNYQIVQSKDSVAILVEMNHDVRIVRLVGKDLADKAHLPGYMRPWMGDSIGWWDGDTLVVETTNFNPGESLRPYFGNSILLSPGAKVTERFTRVSPTQILYRFSVDDPATYSQVWKAEMPLNAAKGPVYEYACHEGNYALPGILAGARKADREGKKIEAVDVSGG
ncbi:hypothetical protein [Phenylobacterium sp.]|jgi:hypothetical protein|uniref:hypothetical protein n=1 Tax=Phenylobacterium sp. TaxID=1871053 RepID=UPI002E315B24|nr:hypothetical protein [Phenylobacterium sp.]HEX3363934.1 hypothetical protein [Phenylobacterium sp.]